MRQPCKACHSDPSPRSLHVQIVPIARSQQRPSSNHSVTCSYLFITLDNVWMVGGERADGGCHPQNPSGSSSCPWLCSAGDVFIKLWFCVTLIVQELASKRPFGIW